MRKKVKNKTLLTGPGYPDNYYQVNYVDGTRGFELIPENKAGQPTDVIEPKDLTNDLRKPGLDKPIPFYRNAGEAMAEAKTPLLKIGEHITKDDAIRFIKDDETMGEEYKKTLLKELDDDLVSAINFDFKDEEEDTKDAPKGGGF